MSSASGNIDKMIAEVADFGKIVESFLQDRQ